MILNLIKKKGRDNMIEIIGPDNSINYMRIDMVGKPLVCLCHCNEKECKQYRAVIDNLLDQFGEIVIRKSSPHTKKNI